MARSYQAFSFLYWRVRNSSWRKLGSYEPTSPNIWALASGRKFPPWWNWCLWHWCSNETSVTRCSTGFVSCVILRTDADILGLGWRVLITRLSAPSTYEHDIPSVRVGQGSPIFPFCIRAIIFLRKVPDVRGFLRVSLICFWATGPFNKWKVSLYVIFRIIGRVLCR